MARNDFIASLQGNRNPFIDSKQYVCYIDFKTMTRVVTSAPCNTTPVGLNELSNLESIKVYPNPAKEVLNLNYELKENQVTTTRIINSIGIEVYLGNKNSSKTVKEEIPLKNLSKGVYYLEVIGENVNSLVKFVKL